MAGGSSDWTALIDHQSSLLTETKDLVGMQKQLIDESRRQSAQNKWTMTIAAITLLASVVLPFIF